MSRRSRLIIGWVATFGVVAVSGCATPSFARVGAFARTSPIPLYIGTPPPEYPYRSLGPVAGLHRPVWGEGSIVTFTKVMEDLGNRARDLGANAVINVTRGEYRQGFFRFDGEAVVFERLPPN